MTTELHLCIIWEHARPQQTTILEHLARNFSIRVAYEITWPRAHFPRNLSRFYGKSLPPGSEKHLHCGDGPFLAVLFEVDQPAYAERNTLAGHQIVLTQVFDLKQHYRDQRQGGLPIHTTNNPTEVEHDLFLLFGKSAAQFREEFPPGKWSGEILPLVRDLTGTEGWPDLTALFAALEFGGRYVVLRNFETLMENPIDEAHNDIDILCDDTSLALFANGRKRFDASTSAHYVIQVGGKALFFDFRHVGDGYYCEAFASAILASRERDSQGFYRPSALHHYYALLYHAVLHKPSFSVDYRTRLNEQAAGAGLAVRLSGNRLQALAVLDDYMNAQSFIYTTPEDTTVAIENGLLAAYREALGLDAFGDERAIAHWLSDNQSSQPDAIPPQLTEHLGLGRANALRPFSAQLGGDILEVGAGSGVLTEYLVTCAHSVTALEPSLRLRPILQQRMQACGHVEILAALPDASGIPRYDTILLDRQLPFAARFLDTAATYAAGALLAYLRRLLRPEGILLLIEPNPLGMDALSGQTATGHAPLGGHVDETRAFGRHEIEQLLEKAGFPAHQWHYAFPDVRTTSTILSSTALDDPEFDVAGLINSTLSNQRTGPSGSFHSQAAWDTAVRNRQIDVLANAFIVHAGVTPQTNAASLGLAFHFSVNRFPQHAKSVSFIRQHDDIIVRHRKLFPAEADATRPALAIDSREFDEPYLPGSPWQLELERALSRPGWRFSAIENWARVWFDHLVALELGDISHPLLAETPVPSRLIDAMPRNLIVTPDGHARFIDLEWQPAENIPLGYVLFRGILLALTSARNIASPAPDTPLNAQGIFLYLCGRFGINVPPTAIADYVRREQAFQHAASGWDWPELTRVDTFTLQIRPGHFQTPTSPTTLPAIEPRPDAHPLCETDRSAYLDALALQRAGQGEAALRSLVEQAERGSQWWEVFNDLGVHLVTHGDASDAMPLFVQALELEPDATEARLNLARLCSLLGRREEALAHLGQLVRQHPQQTSFMGDIRAVLSSFDEIPATAWARLVADLRSARQG